MWTHNDSEHRASCEVIARTVKFQGRKGSNGGAPASEPLPGGHESDDALPV